MDVAQPGDTARSLLVEYRAHLSRGELLPRYADTKVARLTDEIADIHRKLQYAADALESGAPDSDSYRPAADALWEYMLFNKRALLAYTMTRKDQLVHRYWHRGKLEPEDHPSAMEMEWLQQYSDAVSAYSTALPGDLAIDVTTCHVPPKQDKVFVKVLQELGEVATEDGTTVLTKGSIALIPVSTVEVFIREGVVEEHREKAG